MPEEIAYLIPLTRGHHAIVDHGDWIWLRQWKWSTAKKRGIPYACRKTSRKPGPSRTVYMHRQILGLTHGDRREGDHKDHNTLDNRRANLRIVTRRGNAENMSNQSQYGPGIAKSRRHKSRPYQALVKIDGEQYYLGMFPTADEARVVRRKFIEERR